MADFATLADLKARLDWTLDEREESMASAALEDLSDQARYYGLPWVDVPTAPRMVRSMVLAAAARFMRNPDGYTTSRAGDETLAWNDDKSGQAGSPHFNDIEIKALRALAGAKGLTTVGMTAWGPRRQSGNEPGWVPTGANSKDFPYFDSKYEPW